MGDIFIQRLLEDDIMFDEKGDNKLNQAPPSLVMQGESVPDSPLHF